MNPVKRITDPAFRYTNSASTNLEKTFARIRKELKEQREREQANAEEAKRVVKPMVREKT